ncbi:MAG: hypothetical protein JRJ19_04090 [Deltaproteobacteria bacterium]|nr:hypothetical protein [Deltaproteobacteria bacterium]MBW1871219.1 hypothetical protein [Deltaproteobacteria bacterium]
MNIGFSQIKGFAALWFLCALFFTSSTVEAHWCSNVFNSYSKIVVKPERDTIDVAVGASGSLTVRVRNNFPYTIRYIKLRANPPGDLTVDCRISDSPVQNCESDAEGKRIYAGQDAVFFLDITRNSGSDNSVDTLDLEVAINVSGAYFNNDWQSYLDSSSASRQVYETPSAAEVRTYAEGGAGQSAEMNWDVYSTLGCGDCELDGVSELNDWYGQFFGAPGEYNQPKQQGLRAGQAIAIRLRHRGCTSPNRSTVIAYFTDRVGDGGENYYVRGMSAFLAAYGEMGQGNAGLISDITALGTDNSSLGRMAKSALLILDEDYEADVESCRADGGEEIIVRFVCAAALALLGEQNDYAAEFLMPYTGDGTTNDANWTSELIASYMLQLVVHERRGGPDGTGIVSFLDEEVVQDDVAPKAPTNLTVTPAS